MNRTCQRMAMPEDAGVDLHRGHARAGRSGSQLDSRQAWQRPLHPAGDVRDRRAARRASVGTFRFIIETCPSGPYFSGNVDLIAEETYVRAFPGGTGAAKCGGNYAGSMVAALEAQEKGFHNVLWLDGIERRYVEEAGLMNVVFVIDGTVVTPPLERHHPARASPATSVLTLLREMGVPVDERRITIDEVFEAHAAGRCRAPPASAPPR